MISEAHKDPLARHGLAIGAGRARVLDRPRALGPRLILLAVELAVLAAGLGCFVMFAAMLISMVRP